MTTRETTDSSIRMLIAEDEDAFAELVAVLAAQVDGLEVVGRARDGREAVELARSLEPNVIVMDIGMPLLDGIAATGRIRRRNPMIKVVIFTSSDDEHDFGRAREVGAAAYVQKAHIDAVLLGAIRRAVQGDGHVRRAAEEMSAPRTAAAPA